MTPATTTISAAGRRGATACRTRISASEPSPTATVQPETLSRLVSTLQASWKKLPEPDGMPSSDES